MTLALKIIAGIVLYIAGCSAIGKLLKHRRLELEASRPERPERWWIVDHMGFTTAGPFKSKEEAIQEVARRTHRNHAVAGRMTVASDSQRYPKWLL